MYDFYSDRTIFSSRSRPSPRKSLRIVRRFGRSFLPGRFCTGRTGSGSSFPVPPASPRQPTECRTSARRIFLSAGFRTSPLSMRRLLHAVCTRLYLRTDTRTSRLIFPVPPVFAIEYNRGPPCRKFPLTQTRHTRLRPYFDNPDENGPARPPVFPFPNRPLPAHSENFSSLHPPKTFRKPARILPNRDRHARRKGTTAIIHRQLPCSIRTRYRPPLHTGETFRQPSAFASAVYIARRNGNDSLLRRHPAPSSATAQKSRIPAAQKIFSTASHPAPHSPTLPASGRIPDPPDLPCGCRTKIATGKTDRSPPRLRTTDARSPAHRRRHELFVRPLKQTVTRRHTKFSTLRPLPATEVYRVHFPAVHRPEDRAPRPSSAKHKIRPSGRSISLRERKPSGKNRKRDIRKADNEKSRTGPPSKPPQQNLLLSAHRTRFFGKKPPSPLR